jgi:hypothetical protein
VLWLSLALPPYSFRLPNTFKQLSPASQKNPPLSCSNPGLLASHLFPTPRGPPTDTITSSHTRIHHPSHLSPQPAMYRSDSVVPEHDFCSCSALCQMSSVRAPHERNFIVEQPAGCSWSFETQCGGLPNMGIESSLLRPAPLSGLPAGREGWGDWLHGFRLVGFSRPDVVRWSAAFG